MKYKNTNSNENRSKRSNFARIASPFTLVISCLIGLMGVLAACELRSKSNDIIEESKYEKIFLELRMLGLYTESTGDSLRAAKMADSLLSAEGVTKERFQASHAWYEQDVAAQKARFQRLADSLSALDIRISRITSP